MSLEEQTPSDIVERLRATAVLRIDAPLKNEAAGVIDQLRAELALCERRLATSEDLRTGLVTEIEQLRATLEVSLELRAHDGDELFQLRTENAQFRYEAKERARWLKHSG